jgi:hypothetical protein
MELRRCCINHKVLKNLQSQPDHSCDKLIKRRRIPKSVLVVTGYILGFPLSTELHQRPEVKPDRH